MQRVPMVGTAWGGLAQQQQPCCDDVYVLLSSEFCVFDDFS
jgi:hypothetical protein